MIFTSMTRHECQVVTTLRTRQRVVLVTVDTKFLQSTCPHEYESVYKYADTWYEYGIHSSYFDFFETAYCLFKGYTSYSSYCKSDHILASIFYYLGWVGVIPQTYILTRPLSCWYFILELSVPAWKLLLPGKSFIHLYVWQCYIETCRDVWGCLDIWGCLNIQGDVWIPPSLTPPMPSSKVGYPL